MIPLLLHAPLVTDAMFVGALAGCGYVLVQIAQVAIAADWPTVEGEIVGADLIQRGFDGRELVERVTYRYDVAGQPYVSRNSRCVSAAMNGFLEFPRNEPRALFWFA